jgi:hypothetical protein
MVIVAIDAFAKLLHGQENYFQMLAAERRPDRPPPRLRSWRGSEATRKIQKSLETERMPPVALEFAGVSTWARIVRISGSKIRTGRAPREGSGRYFPRD